MSPPDAAAVSEDCSNANGESADPVKVEAVSLDRPPMASVHTPIHPRNLPLVVLATVAFVFVLQLAQKFFIPLLFGIFIAYTLNPPVVWLQRIRISRPFGAALVLLAILCSTAAVTSTLSDEFQSILAKLPDVTHKITRALGKAQSGQPTAIQQMQAAASEIETATSQVTGAKPVAKKIIMSDQPAFKVSDWIWAGSMGAVGFLGQAVIVLLLVFFLLLSGDTFKRKLVKLTGPSLSKKKITVHILDDINTSIQNYMFMLLVTNVLLAFLMWIALRSIGLENAGAWAVAAGLLHVIPYFGPLLIAMGTGVAAFMQFESLSMTILTAGISLAIATIVGTFVTTWMTGRIAKMNPAAIFIALLFWGWIWGVWGLLLGIPIIVIIRVISEHIDEMQPIAELLGE